MFFVIRKPKLEISDKNIVVTKLEKATSSQARFLQFRNREILNGQFKNKKIAKKLLKSIFFLKIL